nr:metallophosphoesterase family protein [Paraburkholderia sacchari]
MAHRFAHDSLHSEQLTWVQRLPISLRFEDDVLLVHGTPQDDQSYFLETVTASGCRVATHGEVRRRAGDIEATLILCGHTHLQRWMKLGDGRLIVNPGSDGLQAYGYARPFPHRMEMGSPRARYATDTRTQFDCEVEFRSVEYDWNDVANRAASNGRSDWETVLRTGYC